MAADEPTENAPEAPARRDQDLLGRKNSACRKRLNDLYDTILKGWNAQNRRADDQMDWWDCYNCKLSAQQFYNGNSQIYVPIVRDAVNARAIRFVNQLFPSSGRYVEVDSADGKQPSDIIALLDYYIQRKKLKTKVARPLTVNGDIEGQYNLYVDWDEITRIVVSRSLHPPTVPMDGAEVEVDEDEFEDIEEEEVEEGLPGLEVLHDSDVLVWPATSDSVDDALERGGGVAIVRRWSRADVEKMIDCGEFLPSEGRALLDRMKSASADRVPDQGKKLVEALGIQPGGEEVTGWEVWTKLPLRESKSRDGAAGWEFSEKDGTKLLCRVWYGPEKDPLGCKRNPYWNDLCPLLSEPQIKVAGSFKGPSLIEPIASLQYEANDAANEGADSAHYAAMPLIRVSPNVTQPIVLNLGAVLKADVNELEMLVFPDLTPRALMRIQTSTTAIFQSLGVNPAMLPQQTGTPGRKRNQAEVALEQQVDLLTTAEAVTTQEEGIYSPLCGWIIDLDHQFRDRSLTARMFGAMGKQAEMQEIPPLQNRARYFFKWLGAESARNAAMLQQQIGAINVLRGLRGELQQEGYRLRLGPVVENMAMGLFGARTGALVIEDMRHQSALDPEFENGLLAEGHEVHVSPLDNDVEHLRSHQQAAMGAGDPLGHFRMHMAGHLQQMQQKLAAQAQQAMAQMMSAQGGPPGGAGPGQPRQGAAPAGPRLVAQQPAGAIHPDQMPAAGAVEMPRKY